MLEKAAFADLVSHSIVCEKIQYADSWSHILTRLKQHLSRAYRELHRQQRMRAETGSAGWPFETNDVSSSAAKFLRRNKRAAPSVGFNVSGPGVLSYA
jgi:hypothetical protein